MFSPFVAILFIKASLTVFSGSAMNFSSNKASTSAGLFKATCFTISLTNCLNSAFSATKSVSALTSAIAPTFPSSEM